MNVHRPTPHAGATSRSGALRERVMAVARRVWQLIARVAEKAWGDSIFAKSAAAAFWQTLSLAPLLLGLLGSIGYIGGLFGPDTVHIVEGKIISFSRNLFSGNVVDEMIAPTVRDVLQRGRGAVVSVGFVLSLWAGSSAMATFVDSIVAAHGQADARHPVWQRIFALGLYLLFLVAAVFVLPLVALGPTLIGRALPPGWREPGLRLIDNFYYPAAGLLLIVGLTTLYKLALHRSLPWHRLFGGAVLAGIFFMTASDILRRYLTYAARAGVSYGALATPIAFLLFTFFLAFAVILGAEFNATVQEFWPARATRFEQLKQWWARHHQQDEAAGDSERASATDAVGVATGHPGPESATDTAAGTHGRSESESTEAQGRADSDTHRTTESSTPAVEPTIRTAESDASADEPSGSADESVAAGTQQAPRSATSASRPESDRGGRCPPSGANDPRGTGHSPLPGTGRAGGAQSLRIIS